MSTSSTIGTLGALWRFPVKSMQGEQIDRVELEARGIVGDRGYGLIDAATGKVVSAKSVLLFPTLLHCSARFVAAPRAGEPLPAVRITLPNGIEVESGADDADRSLSNFFQRDVRLTSAAPADFTIDHYHPDLGDADPAAQPAHSVEQKLGAALFATLGMPSPVPVGAFHDVFPLSLLASSTLARLRQLAPQTRFDERRFRMNATVKTTANGAEAGFVENDWIGRVLHIGDTIRLRVAMPDPRCVVTTRAQPGLPEDLDVLRTLLRHNRPKTAIGQFPCAGAYAAIEAAGMLRVGDVVSIAD